MSLCRFTAHAAEVARSDSWTDQLISTCVCGHVAACPVGRVARFSKVARLERVVRSGQVARHAELNRH